MTGTVPLEERLKWRERPARRPIMYQTWRHLLFAHWEVDREVLQASLPPGLTVDTWEGRAYVGIIPFFMRNVRPKGVPPLPWISNFLEMNVRAYVHDASGAPGVWFYSLDCNQPFAVWLARMLLGLPYRHARMKARRMPDGAIDYHSRRRRFGASARFLYRIEPPGRPAEPGTLEFFLIERYLLFTQHRGRLFRAQVHHHPYPLSNAELGDFHASGFTPLGPAYNSRPSHLIGSSGVAVELFGAEAAAV